MGAPHAPNHLIALRRLPKFQRIALARLMGLQQQRRYTLGQLGPLPEFRWMARRREPVFHAWIRYWCAGHLGPRWLIGHHPDQVDAAEQNYQPSTRLGSQIRRHTPRLAQWFESV